MKNISKLFTAIVALTIASAASADPGHRGNYVGAVPPVGNVVYYGGHHHGGYYRNGCFGSDCALVVLGSVALGAVIANEVRRQPEVIYVQPAPQPRVVYVPSNPNLRCDGGVVIDGNYYCPRLTN